MAELASGKLLLDEPADGRRPAADPQRGAPRRARPRDPRHARRDRRAGSTPAASCSPARAPMFSAGYDLGNLEGREFEENAEKLVAHPFHSALEALEAFPYPVIGAAQRPRHRRRAGAGADLRHPDRGARDQARACRRPSSA